MKKIIWYIVIFLCLLIINNTYAACPTSYDWKNEIKNKSENRWLVLTKDNVRDICSNTYNEYDRETKDWLLNCSNRWISQVNSDTFSELTGFDKVKIDLSCNYLTWLTVKSSNKLETLVDMDLSDNNINDLSEINLYKLKNLKELYLDGNQITSIKPWYFSNFKNIDGLYLSDNKISEIYSWTFIGLDSLFRLILHNNPIKYIEPTSLSSLKNLQTLYIALPTKITTWIFEWLNQMNSLIFYLDNWNINEDTIIQTWFFYWLDNINRLIIVWSWNTIDPSKWDYSWLENLWSLDYAKIKINNIKAWTFKELKNLEYLNLPSNIIEIEPWAFDGLEKLKMLSFGILGDIQKEMFNWLNNLILLHIKVWWNLWEHSFSLLSNLTNLELTVGWNIEKNSFSQLYNLADLYLNIEHKKDVSKSLFLDMKNLDKLSLHINDRKDFNCNEDKNIIKSIRTAFYYRSLGITKALPNENTYTIYNYFKYWFISLIIFIILLIIVNKYMKIKRGIWIIFSYFTMREYSKYLSTTKKRWWHILAKIILWIVFFIPLWLYLTDYILYDIIKYNNFEIYYQVVGNLEDRFTDNVVSKETLVLEWETPWYWENKKFFKQDYKVESFDSYDTYWCTNSWDINKLKVLEERTWKPYTLDNYHKEEFYETFLNNMKKDNIKCIEDRIFWDTLEYRSWVNWYTHVWKITFLSLLMTIWERLLHIWIALIMWWILRYFIMFFYYNIVLFFIKWNPRDDLDEILSELSNIDLNI